MFVAGGAYTGKTGSNPFFVVPVAELGTNIDFYLTNHLTMSLSLSGSYYFDKKIPGIAANASRGAGYRF